MKCKYLSGESFLLLEGQIPAYREKYVLFVKTVHPMYFSFEPGYIPAFLTLVCIYGKAFGIKISLAGQRMLSEAF